MAAGLAIAGTALALGRRRRQWAGGLALAGFCVALVLIPLSVRLEQVRASPIAALARAHTVATVEVTVSADPRLLAATGVAGASRVAVEAKLSSVSTAGQARSAAGRVLILAPAPPWLDLLPGQHVRVDGTLIPPLGDPLAVATISSDADPVRLGQPPWWQRAAGVVRASLRRAAAGLPAEPRGLLPGLVDGDTSGLDPVLADRFRLAGLTHLVAVSGVSAQ
jgi:competence protein ComEC